MWHPFRDFEDNLFLRRMGVGPLIHVGNWTRGDYGGLHSTFTGRWIPDVDLTEEPASFTLTADLPGMKKEDMEVNVTGNKVCVRGTRADSKAMASLQANNGWVHCNERGTGKFERCFTLPHDVVESSVKAQFADGVLEVNLQKQNKTVSGKPSHIDIL